MDNLVTTLCQGGSKIGRLLLPSHGLVTSLAFLYGYYAGVDDLVVTMIDKPWLPFPRLKHGRYIYIHYYLYFITLYMYMYTLWYMYVYVKV